MKRFIILLLVINLGVTGCTEPSDTAPNSNRETDGFWYLTDGQLRKKFDGSIQHIDFTLIQKHTNNSVVSSFLLYDAPHRGFNLLIHRRIRAQDKFLESWDFHETKSGRSELSCFESLNDYLGLPATLRLVAWAHAPFRETIGPQAHAETNDWVTTDIPVANSNLYKLEQIIDPESGMPKEFTLWMSPQKVTQIGKVTHIARIDDNYMPMGISIATDEQETAVRFRNGEVIDVGHSVNIIEAYSQYIDFSNQSCIAKQFTSQQFKQL